MGIPHYFYIITKNYPGIIHLSKPQECTNFFLDFNGMIHHAVHEIIKNSENISEFNSQDAFENKIMENCWEYLNECIKIVNPTSIVHICIDGVAPIAKMNQQRKRRYLSVFQSKLKNEKRIWDTNAISPGTQFMAKLKAFLSGKIRDTRSKFIYFLSAADDPGEGEHKIMSRIASLKDTDTVYIYGLDADLIMLSLLSHHKNIYLMREPQHSGKELASQKNKNNAKSESGQNSESEFIYLNIHALRVALIQELYMSFDWPLSDLCRNDPYSQDAKNCIETYVVLCFLLGNDFLPHIPALSLKKNGHTQILKAAAIAWKIYNSSGVENNKIHTAFILNVLQTLQKDETKIIIDMNNEYLFKRPYTQPDFNSSTTLQSALDPSHCYPIQNENKDPLAEIISKIPDNLVEFHWRSMYYKHLFHTKKNNSEIIAESSRLYIEGIYWTYAYYKRMPRNCSWYYPYGYSPTIQDIANNIQANINDYDNLLESWKTNSTNQTTSTHFVDPNVQLFSILPYESKHLLPFKLQQLMDNTNYGAVHLFPRIYKIQTYLKTHLWECTPVLPPLDIELIKLCISRLQT